MENILNTTDGWEAIINEPGRQERIQAFHQGRKQKKINDLTGKAFLLAAGSSLIGGLGLFGALTMWLAAPICVVLNGAACYTYGRITELKHRGGGR